jgi:hypothetical protein
LTRLAPIMVPACQSPKTAPGRVGEDRHAAERADVHDRREDRAAVLRARRPALGVVGREVRASRRRGTLLHRPDACDDVPATSAVTYPPHCSSGSGTVQPRTAE